jgi:hypothetical protein
VNPEQQEPKDSAEPPLEAIPGGGEPDAAGVPANGHGDSALAPAFELEKLLLARIDRREREARVEKVEHQADHEPKRLRMGLWERAAFIAVVTIAAVAGATLIAFGVSGNLALVPGGCVLLSGATGTVTYLYRLRKKREEEEGEEGED